MKYTAVIVLSSLVLAACSHHKKVEHNRPLVSFFKGNPNHSTIMRGPASTIPGLASLKRALKSNKGWKSSLAGKEVVIHHLSVHDNVDDYEIETRVYLKANNYGHFYLEKFNDKTWNLVGNETDYHNISAVVDGMVALKEVKKVSSSVYALTLYENDSTKTCNMALDLKKPLELATMNCTDSSGKVFRKMEIVSVKEVNLSDYKAHLKSTKIEVAPLFLENGEKAYSVIDEDEKDWTYLIQK